MAAAASATDAVSSTATPASTASTTEKWLSKTEIEALAGVDARFKLLKRMFSFVKAGSRRISDVKKIGPANPEKCKMSCAQWDSMVTKRKKDGQCVGTFFTSFEKKNIHFEGAKSQQKASATCVRRCGAGREQTA